MLKDKVKERELKMIKLLGEEFSNDIIEKAKNLNNTLKLYTYNVIIEFNGTVIPNTITTDKEISSTNKLLQKLNDSTDKKSVLLEILETVKLTDEVKLELSKYRDILTEIKERL